MKGVGVWEQRKGECDQDRVNQENRVSSQDEAGDTGRALRMTQVCVATGRKLDFVPRTKKTQWRSEAQGLT